MRSLGFVALVVLLSAAIESPASAADNELTSEEKAAGWKLLFNGQDNTGWECNNGKPVATPVEDGSLVPYKSGGYLIVYKQPFGDFKLQCDVKMHDEKTNSGIFLRVGDLKNPVFTGLEIQVGAGGTGMHDFGAIYDLVGAKKNVAKGPGEWNHVEITCQGPTVAVSVNGEETAKMNADEFKEPGLRPDGSKHKFKVAIKDLPRSGYFGFQDHGHPVWFKNVKLLELKP